MVHLILFTGIPLVGWAISLVLWIRTDKRKYFLSAAILTITFLNPIISGVFALFDGKVFPINVWDILTLMLILAGFAVLFLPERYLHRKPS